MSKVNNEITEEQRQAIDNYGNKIVTLKDMVTAIRKLPGMYCAGKGNTGFLSLIREIYQNCVDQVIDPLSPANHIDFYYNENTLEVIVSDNGLGFPFEDMVRMVTVHHTSKNYVKKKGEYSSGMHGSGLKVVNALSCECNVESYRYDGTAKRIDLVEGYLDKGPYDIPNKEKRQGSTVRFVPSTDVLGDITLEWKSVYLLIKRILSLTPIGSEVNFRSVDHNGVEHNEFIVNKDGIITELINNVTSPMCKPIVLSEDTGEMKLDIAFVYDSGGENGPDPMERVTAFCNMCPTIAGFHIDGAVDGICRWFVGYMNNIFLANQKAKQKTKVAAVDIKSGLNIMISAACLEPVFVGQAKEQLNNPEMAGFCKQVITKGLDEWSKNNPADLQKLCKYFKDIADIRMKSESSKAKIVTSYKSNALTGLPTKYAKPTERNYEFIIVEGDSAGGSAKTGRDETCQGIFPIRGKISSAYSTAKDKFWANPETQGIARIILNGDYRRNFDPIKDVEWDKIIFMADADIDGYHISTLLLRFFIRYMPQLIEAGKVYKAVPPLYSIQNGKKIQYFTDPIDFVRYVQKNFIQSNTLSDIDTKKDLSSKDITVLFMKNEDYVYEIERLALTYAVEPELLELGLFSYYNKTSIKALQKSLKQQFRFMNVEENKGSFIFNGTIKETNFLSINDRLIKDCERALDIIKKNDKLYYLMNGKVSSIYQIMKKFDQSTPTGIQRYKGLGEMADYQIAESTLRPDADRTLIRYTLEDAKAEIEAIREYESDRSKLLEFVGTVKRSDLLD